MARVLIGYSACPLTRAAFERAGHETWTCDLLPARGDSNGRHLQCDIWDALIDHQWDFGVLHPMCTYLTCSAAWAYGDGPYHQKVKPGTLVGAARRAARTEAIENFRRLLALPFPIAAENPGVSFLNTAIRPPDQIIQPNQFGDDASKATGLWLTKDTPKLVGTKDVPPRMVNGRPRWANQTDSGQNRLSPSDTRWLERSATYPGIADAMGTQWGAWLHARGL
jgi:hypothetical protein